MPQCYTVVPVNKVKLWNQQHVLFCSFTIKETNFVLILVVQLSEVAAATTNMTDLSRHEYDWRLWLSHINMTDSDLTKYDWRWRLGDGGSGVWFYILCLGDKIYLETAKESAAQYSCIIAPQLSFAIQGRNGVITGCSQTRQVLTYNISLNCPSWAPCNDVNVNNVF